MEPRCRKRKTAMSSTSKCSNPSGKHPKLEIHMPSIRNEPPITVAEYAKGMFRMPSMSQVQKQLIAERVVNLPVMVVCVTGKCRTGKSFWLNYLLRFLISKEEGQADGTFGDEEARLDGFQWAEGSETITKGIQMWNHVFKIKKWDKEVAVILLDTQGLFDGNMDTSGENTLLSFGIEASSVLLFNIKEQITEESLRTLELAISEREFEQDVKRGQVLEFLVRDWIGKTTHSFGKDGGEAYLNSILEKNTAEENKNRRRNISAYFETIRCFLLPHPGSHAAGYGEEEEEKFIGSLNQLNNSFKNHLLNFCEAIFSPSGIACVKDELGKEMTCGDLFSCFERIATTLGSGDVMNCSPLETIKLWKFSRLRQQAIDMYKTDMNQVVCGTGPFIQVDKIQHYHQMATAKALCHLKKNLEKWPKEEQTQIKELGEEIQQSFYKISLINGLKAKDTRQADIQNAMRTYIEKMEQALSDWNYRTPQLMRRLHQRILEDIKNTINLSRDQLNECDKLWEESLTHYMLVNNSRFKIATGIQSLTPILQEIAPLGASLFKNTFAMVASFFGIDRLWKPSLSGGG